jgi:hypothetical protein
MGKEGYYMTPQTFWSKLRYAFSIEDDSEDIQRRFSDEEIRLLDKVADGIVKRRLSSPALIFLESVRPLNFLSSQAIVFLQPIVGLIISKKEIDLLAKILEKRESIPLLIELIEKKEEAVKC